jgi:cell division protease FtsH
MAMRYGMGTGELGTAAYGERQGTVFLGVDPASARNYSEETAKAIDSFVRGILGKQLERAQGMLKKYREKLDELADMLLKKETMSVEEFVEIFEGHLPTAISTRTKTA